MCFNKEVSIVTYVIGMTGCAALISIGHIPEAIFFGWVVQMQLIEFFLWRYQPCSDHELVKKNKITTAIGILVNNMETIVLWVALLYFGIKRLPMWVNYIMVVFTLSTILYTKKALDEMECTTSTAESAPHLHWKWNYSKYKNIYYTFFIFTLLLLCIYGLKNGYKLALLAFFSYCISYLIYDGKHSVGAMWCFFAAFIPWILALFYVME